MIHACMHTCIHTCIQRNVQVIVLRDTAYMHIYFDTFMHACLRTYMHTEGRAAGRSTSMKKRHGMYVCILKTHDVDEEKTWYVYMCECMYVY